MTRSQGIAIARMAGNSPQLDAGGSAYSAHSRRGTAQIPWSLHTRKTQVKRHHKLYNAAAAKPPGQASKVAYLLACGQQVVGEPV